MRALHLRAERGPATAAIVSRLRKPQRTVRWRLTLLYAGLFLVCGAGLLAVTYALVSHSITGSGGVTLHPVGGRGGKTTNSRGDASPLSNPRLSIRKPSTDPPLIRDRFSAGYRNVEVKTSDVQVPPAVRRVLESSAGQEFLGLVETQQRVDDLHKLETESAIALGLMAILSAVLGWFVAGRVLRPLRTITATTQQISEDNLHRRLALPGPRDELRTLADTIDSLLARLEAAFASQRRFVANASHELRTPLTTMRAVLDVAIAEPDAPPQVRELDLDLREDLDQADRLLESFLVLAHAQHGELSDKTPVSLTRVVGDTLARRADQIAGMQIELHSTLSPTCVEGSEPLLARMVDNLIDNAVRHNPPRGDINVTCNAERETARLVVESGGSVLDEEAVSRLAEPFRRLGAARTGSENGHGLGLSIVAAIAAAHGGELALHAREPGGLGAEITLPAAPRAHAETGLT